MFNLRKLAVTGLVTATLAAGGIAAAVVPASAATAHTATVSAAQRPSLLTPVPQGPNRLRLTFNGQTFTYNVRFRSFPVGFGVWLVTGTLRDTFEPVSPLTLRIHGVQFGNVLVFSVEYPSVGPDAGNQGVRTFSMLVTNHFAAGSWTETGTEAGSGPASLVFPLF